MKIKVIKTGVIKDVRAAAAVQLIDGGIAEAVKEPKKKAEKAPIKDKAKKDKPRNKAKK